MSRRPPAFAFDAPQTLLLAVTPAVMPALVADIRVFVRCNNTWDGRDARP